MKKSAFLLLSVLFFSAVAMAQGGTKSLKQVMTLKIDREGGANAANIAWHPVQKKYYAAMAGNETFPMEVFDAKGKMLSPNDLETKFDVRGLWYNPATKTLQANGYDDYGWSEYKLNAKGMPTTNTKLEVTSSKPDPQSVGAFNPKKNVLYFLDASTMSLEPHSMKDGVVGELITLHLGQKTDKDPEGTKEGYNDNAIIYTGIAKGEIGLLNVDKMQIELYNLATGYMTQVLKLPENAPANMSLNFSFTNGIYWLFDKTARIWHGYK